MRMAITTYSEEPSMRFPVYLALACLFASCRSTQSHSSTSEASPVTADAVVYTIDKGEKAFSTATPVHATDKRVEDTLTGCAFSNTAIPAEVGFRANEMEFAVVYDRAQAEQGLLVANTLDIRLRPATGASFTVNDDASDLVATFKPEPADEETTAIAATKAPAIAWNTVTVRALAPEGLAIKLTGTYQNKAFTAYCSGNDGPMAEEQALTTAAASTAAP